MLESVFDRRRLGAGVARQVICAISFGYADDEHPTNRVRIERATLTDAVRYVSCAAP